MIALGMPTTRRPALDLGGPRMIARTLGPTAQVRPPHVLRTVPTLQLRGGSPLRGTASGAPETGSALGRTRPARPAPSRPRAIPQIQSLQLGTASWSASRAVFPLSLFLLPAAARARLSESLRGWAWPGLRTVTADSGSGAYGRSDGRPGRRAAVPVPSFARRLLAYLIKMYHDGLRRALAA